MFVFSLRSISGLLKKTALFVDMVLFSLYICYCPIYMFTLKYINLTRYTANIWSYLTGFNKARIGETWLGNGGLKINQERVFSVVLTSHFIPGSLLYITNRNDHTFSIHDDTLETNSLVQVHNQYCFISRDSLSIPD